jgi:glycosyltransferase involved in cell wall biosynthesis
MLASILVLADWYLPGCKAGGSVSAIANLIELVGDEFRFHVITRDRDLTDESPYTRVQTEEWISVGKAHVLYTSDLSFANLRRHILDVDPHIVYLNSFFSLMTRRILLMRRLGLLPRSAVILAPRGELAPAALRLKPLKKWLYLRLAARTSLFREVTWQANSERERQHIATVVDVHRKQNCEGLIVTPDVPNAHWPELLAEQPKPAKRPGAVRLLFLSRISRMKNLRFALESLSSLDGHAEFEIVGPLEDARYWAECQEKIRLLPANIAVRSTGPVQHEGLRRTFLRNEFLLLPTLGESFGYAILEALEAGCPVIISDQTPWRNLQGAGAGWDLPLGRLDQWRKVLDECVAMDDESYQQMSKRASCFAQKWLSAAHRYTDTINLFDTALSHVAS